MAENILAARLRQVVEYSPDTGAFVRRVRLAQRHQVGDRADAVITSGTNAGYRRVSFDSRRYLAHRLAWLYVHGEWPAQHIDHINGDRGDNRLCNLRPASEKLNVENMRRARTDNKAGLLGVHKHTDGRWRARIQSNGACIHIGLFDTPEAAHAAYLKRKREIHAGCTI